MLNEPNWVCREEGGVINQRKIREEKVSLREPKAQILTII